jgi:hypothetical protein
VLFIFAFVNSVRGAFAYHEFLETAKKKAVDDGEDIEPAGEKLR